VNIVIKLPKTVADVVPVPEVQERLAVMQNRFIKIVFGIVFSLTLTDFSVASNSCSNIKTFGLADQSGIIDNEYGIYAIGTFRIDGEQDEHKQPMFNYSNISCENNNNNSDIIYCTLTKASVSSEDAQPNAEMPNCDLDLDISSFVLKKITNKIYSGTDAMAGGIETTCYNTMLTIDKNSNKVFLNFIRTKYADTIEKTMPHMCNPQTTQVLMNCTYWAKFRASRKTDKPLPTRYCDFSGSGDK